MRKVVGAHLHAMCEWQRSVLGQAAGILSSSHTLPCMRSCRCLLLSAFASAASCEQQPQALMQPCTQSVMKAIVMQASQSSSAGGWPHLVNSSHRSPCIQQLARRLRSPPHSCLVQGSAPLLHNGIAPDQTPDGIPLQSGFLGDPALCTHLAADPPARRADTVAQVQSYSAPMTANI
jgi:hypothetical protein